tara:strand:+ start:751 stop:972 length:222 start_codon:yes stop_codon:yes gene_type:complete
VENVRTRTFTKTQDGYWEGKRYLIRHGYYEDLLVAAPSFDLVAVVSWANELMTLNNPLLLEHLTDEQEPENVD